MIDLHTHILPNLDDGSSSVEESLTMAKALRRQKIMKIVCTPHFDPTRVSLQEFLDKRTRAVLLLKDSKVALIAGSETALHDYLFHYPDLSGLCIGDTRYLLLELTFENKWDEKQYEAVEKLISRYNVCPIIAHVERYPAVKRSIRCIKRLIDIGCVIQVNTSSIIEKSSRNQVFHYMKKGYVDVLGSDCHNMGKRPPIFIEAVDIIIRKLGEQYCNQLKYNAECIVKGMNLRERMPFIL